MNIKESREFLNKNGIYQLNRGETLKDALDSVKKGISRKGYRFKKDNGRLMTQNEIIANENNISFHKSFTPSVFSADEVESIDDISSTDDYRENKGERGVTINCFYCGWCLRVDDVDGLGDYPKPIDTIHCESCGNDAISRLAM